MEQLRRDGKMTSLDDMGREPREKYERLRNMSFRETYLARLKEMRTKYPEAHFEVVTRTARSVLAPDADLLSDFMERKAKLVKEGLSVVEAHNKAWEDVNYERRFRNFILSSPEAMKRLEELREIEKAKDVYLVCYEKPPKKCHRFILLDIFQEELEKENARVAKHGRNRS